MERIYRLTCELDIPHDLYLILSAMSDQTGKTINELGGEVLKVFFDMPTPEELRSQLQKIYNL